MDITGYAYLDTETITLARKADVIWEIGIVRTTMLHHVTDRHTMQVRPDLYVSDPAALDVGRFEDRFCLSTGEAGSWLAEEGGEARLYRNLTRGQVYRAVWDLLTGQIVVGNVPWFDTTRLEDAVYACTDIRKPPPWHHHLIDVENLIAGAFGVVPPWNSENLSRLVGVDPGQFDRHTALGDCEWARAQYRAVRTLRSGERRKALRTARRAN